MLTGQGMVDFAMSKVGTPYFYGSKFSVLTEAFMTQMNRQYPKTVTANYMAKARKRGQVGKVNVDCSGLIQWYTGKALGSAQLYSSANARLSVSDYKDWANGVVCWRQGHVGIFYSDNNKYYVIEAKGIDYGTVVSEFNPKKWSAGLTFDWINYTYDVNIGNNADYPGINPYEEPTALLRKGSKGVGVRWLQFELREAGFDIEIDGQFGPATDKAVRAFQKSAKLDVDGLVGKNTRSALKNDVPEASEASQSKIGIDVAKYQGNINWNKVKENGIAFAILKATQKDNTAEPAFYKNFGEAKAVGIPLGVYKYVYALSEGQGIEEAKNVIKVLGDRKLEGHVWLDMEDKSLRNLGKFNLSKIINAEAKVFEEAGYKVGIYCNVDWYNNVLDGKALSTKYPFWIAKYGKNTGDYQNRDDAPKNIAQIWQYTSKGKVPGISGNVDMNLMM